MTRVSLLARDELSHPELHALVGMLEGLSAAESAKARYITVDTEKSARLRLFRRLEVHGAAPAVAVAFQRSYVLPDDRPAPCLSARELQVVACLALGLLQKGTGERMGISELTVKSHLARIHAKTERRGSGRTVALCFWSRLLPVGRNALERVSLSTQERVAAQA